MNVEEAWVNFFWACVVGAVFCTAIVNVTSCAKQEQLVKAGYNTDGSKPFVPVVPPPLHVEK